MELSGVNDPVVQSVARSMDQPNEQLREKRVELILQQLEVVPSLPQPVADVVRAATPADASRALPADGDLAQRVLKLARAVTRDPALTLDSFLQNRGIDALRYAALSVGTYQSFATAA